MAPMQTATRLGMLHFVQQTSPLDREVPDGD